MYDRLFTEATPDIGHGDIHFTDFVNTDSCEVFNNAFVEPSLLTAESGDTFQFERQGYFVADCEDHKPGENLVFNRTVTLRDTWSKR